MRTGVKGRQLPKVGIDQGEQFDVRPAVLDCLDDRRDRVIGTAITEFRTVSPMRTIPPLRILQLSPDRLISGSKIDLPVISSMCRQGIDSRVASSSVSPSQNCFRPDG